MTVAEKTLEWDPTGRLVEEDGCGEQEGIFGTRKLWLVRWDIYKVQC